MFHQEARNFGSYSFAICPLAISAKFVGASQFSAKKRLAVFSTAFVRGLPRIAQASAALILWLINTDHWWSFVRQKQLSESYASESRLSRLSRRLSKGNRKPCWNCMSLLGLFQVKQDFKRLMDPGNFWVDWGLSLQHEANGKPAAWLSGVLASESIVERYGGPPCQLPKRELPWTYHQSCNPFLRQPVQPEQALLQGKEGMFQLKALLVQRLFGRDFEPGLYSTVVERN